MSVNKLAELLVTPSAARRRRIVYDQKHPSDAIVARYRMAMPAVAEYLTSDFDAGVIDRHVMALRSDQSGGIWHREDRDLTADALEHVLQLASNLPQDGVTYSRPPAEPARLEVEGVQISVRPDMLLTTTIRGRRYSGAMKFHFTRNEESALTRRGAEFVAMVMQEWLTQFGTSGATPRGSLCIAVDVFRRAQVSAPTSVARRWEEVVAGCQEIAARWPQL
jgi:hypothetical protein